MTSSVIQKTRDKTSTRQIIVESEEENEENSEENNEELINIIID